MIACRYSRKTLMIILSVILIEGAFGSVLALDDVGSMRCDQETIMPGATKFQVIDTCGDPDAMLVKGYAKEVWVYNFGPTKFIHYLTFLHGRLERIQLGEYGDYQQSRAVE